MANQSEILKHRGKTYTLRELPETFSPSWVEKKIINARIEGKSIAEMDDADARIFVDKLILNAAAITGCGLPQTEFFAEILTEQVKVFITEYGYEMLTSEEISLALFLNEKRNVRLMSGIELIYVDFVGNHFNVSYLSKILHNYGVLRGCLDRKFQNFIDGHE